MGGVRLHSETPAALYCGIVSLGVLAFLPAMMEVLWEPLHWTDQVVGRFATADLTGLVIGTLIAALVSARFAASRVVGAGGAILLLANLLSTLSPLPWVLISLRAVGGLGAGLMLGTCYALYARGKPIRNFALFQAGQQFLSVVAPLTLTVAVGIWGWQASFAILAVLTMPVLVLAGLLPREPWAVRHEVTSATPVHTPPVVWLAIAGTVIWWAGQSATWTYLALIGTASGIPSHDVQLSLSLGAFCGLFTVFIPLLIGTRFGTYPPLIIALSINVSALFLLDSTTLAPYRFAVCAFMGIWGVFAAYQFSAIVSVDRGGSATRVLSTASYTGALIGPLIAGELATAGGYGWVILMAIITNVIGLAVLLPLRGRLARSALASSSEKEKQMQLLKEKANA